jgi:hypothetical protein
VFVIESTMRSALGSGARYAAVSYFLVLKNAAHAKKRPPQESKPRRGQNKRNEKK